MFMWLEVFTQMVRFGFNDGCTVTPSRCISFALQADETTTDDEILIDDCQHGIHGREMDRSEIAAGMEVGLESGYSNTDVHFKVHVVSSRHFHHSK